MASETVDLGALLAVHRHRRASAMKWIVLVATVGIGLIILGALGWAVYTAALSGAIESVAAGAFVGLFFLGAGSAISWLTVRDTVRDEVIELYDFGVSHTVGGVTQELPWTEIDALVCGDHAARTGPGQGGSQTYTLWFRGERRVDLSSTRHTEVDGETWRLLRTKSQQVLFPKYLTSIQQGGRVRLGPVTIDSHGIRSNTQEVRFKGMTGVALDGPKLILTDVNGTETRVDVAQQPNVHVMVALCEHLAAGVPR